MLPADIAMGDGIARMAIWRILPSLDTARDYEADKRDSAMGPLYCSMHFSGRLRARLAVFTAISPGRFGMAISRAGLDAPSQCQRVTPLHYCRPGRFARAGLARARWHFGAYGSRSGCCCAYCFGQMARA